MKIAPYLLNLFEIVTVGLPFCVFKILAGQLLVSHDSKVFFIVGSLLIALGIVDCIINLINFFSTIIQKKRFMTICTLSQFGRYIITLKQSSTPSERLEDFGSALDVLLSFVIVAAVIGTGSLLNLNSSELLYWNISVIFNVLGAGMIRVISAMDKLSQ